MSSVYKQFTAQDFATVPFNAHKQYNLNSSSAASNKITYHSAKWTSESISLYSSASSNPYGVFDMYYTGHVSGQDVFMGYLKASGSDVTWKDLSSYQDDNGDMQQLNASGMQKRQQRHTKC